MPQRLLFNISVDLSPAISYLCTFVKTFNLTNEGVWQHPLQLQCPVELDGEGVRSEHSPFFG